MERERVIGGKGSIKLQVSDILGGKDSRRILSLHLIPDPRPELLLLRPPNDNLL